MFKLFVPLLWTMGLLILALILSVLGFLLYLTITEFSPVLKSKATINGKGIPLDPARREFTFFAWNIGYAGLGVGMDFFYEGGKLVRPEKAQCERYLDGIKKVVLAHHTADFILLQEVDVYSKRSWFNDEFAALSTMLPDFCGVFAPNYDCRYIPVPLMEPMGRVRAGLASFMRAKPESAEIQYFNAGLPWPKRMAFLKRCFVMMRFKLDNGKDLVVLGTHNSSYDSTGVFRKTELTLLDSAMKAEYRQGNYVVAGGDWNSNPRGFNASKVISGDVVTTEDLQIEPGFLSGWQFVFDPLQPTNRNLDMPYKKGSTKTTIIDFFVVSPNIEVKHIEAIPLGFVFSDHNPVVMGIRLK